MLKTLLIPADALWYSAVAGANQYLEDGTEYTWLSGEKYPVVRHCTADEQFHLRPMQVQAEPEQIAWVTAHGVPEMFVWPVDAAAKAGAAPSYQYVFRNLPAAKLRNLSEWTAERNTADDPAAAEAAARYARMIVQDARHFYACGYAYYGWNPEMIYPAADGKSMIYDFSGTADRAAAEKPFPQPGVYKLLTDPAKTQYCPDLDYFGLMVLLFYVLIGKYPYDGRLMDGIGRATALEQDAWYETYRRNSVFIFDPHDSRNSVGTFEHEKIYCARWESLPADVRALFTQTFCGKQGGPNTLTVSPDTLISRCAFFRGEQNHDD